MGKFELNITSGITICITDDIMRVYKKSNLLVEDKFYNYILTWNKTDKSLGIISLNVLFAHPACEKDFQITINKGSKDYDKTRFFVDQIADIYFKKDIQSSFLKACGYARKIYLQANQKDSISIEKSNGNDSFYNEIKLLPGFDSWGTKKEIKHLYTMLFEGEKVFSVASGIMDGNTWLVACTDKRILFIDCGMIYGVKHIEIMINKINSVSFKNGLILGEIYVQDGATIKTIKNVQKYSTKPFVDAVHKAMKMLEDDRKQFYREKSNISAADEILKFKNLLELGVISKEEFEKQKKKILDI